MCEGEEEPLCVKWCMHDALVLEEREVDVEDQEESFDQEDLEIGLESLADKFGMDKVMDAFARMNKQD
jgi:benzoyl-CoA reductase subunit BamC